MDPSQRNTSGVLLKREGHRSTLSMARWSRKYVTFTVTQRDDKPGTSAVIRYFAASSAEGAEGTKPRKELLMDACHLRTDPKNWTFEVRAARGYTIVFKCAASEELEQWVSRMEPSTDLRERLIAFYKEQNPRKLSQVNIVALPKPPCVWQIVQLTQPHPRMRCDAPG